MRSVRKKKKGETEKERGKSSQERIVLNYHPLHIPDFSQRLVYFLFGRFSWTSVHYTGGSCATRMQRKRRRHKSGKGKGDCEGWTIGELSASILRASLLLFAFFSPIKNLDNRFGIFSFIAIYTIPRNANCFYRKSELFRVFSANKKYQLENIN